ncbi:uncharacterized protein EV154DRAFT_496740 [Mucor mucedo]|uniref:uncharacterized protein n=1 Tax=Mucor mucedo TaxID=29922 RepID=UPI00221FBADC|nr:uncharacterized protein EV154DRAFT_496740 [Mucor mucedo]KAI7895026.1 hypothetical protein EV154DRAFT_496740 [Mucor mucedo]
MNKSFSRIPSVLKQCRVSRLSQAKQSLRSSHLFVTPALVGCQRLAKSSVGSFQVQSKSWNSTVSEVAASLGDCPGCGAPFQKVDSAKPGFLTDRKKSNKDMKKQGKTMSNEEYKSAVADLDPETRALLEGEEIVEEDIKETHHHEERNVCQRCYALQHHNATTTESTPAFLRASQQYGSLEFLKTKQDPLIVTVFDVTDLPASLGNLPQLIAKNPGARILLAANKMDILPASARKHEQRIRDWIVQHTKSLGLPTNQILSVTLISAKKGWGIPTLMRKIDRERRPTDDVYLVGCTNVGKSALVNQFMSQIRGTLDAEGRRLKSQLKAQYKITSSAIPGTTMGTIKVPLYALGIDSAEEGENKDNWEKRKYATRNRYLIDTPGVINDQQLIHQLGYNDQKKAVGQKEMNPVTFKLEPGKSLLLKPLVRIDLLESSGPVMFTMFSPLAPHLTRTEKLPAAHALEDKTNNLRPVKDESILRMSSLVPMDEVIRVNGIHRSQASVDFSFAGVGWVSLTGEFDNAKFRVWLPKDVKAHEAFQMRDPPFLPFEYKGSIRKFFGSGERTRK